MAADAVDLLVVGAGITGAGIARDAAMRGIRTALVDKGDFGGGTSSNSSRLVHGGLRYLEHRHWRLVFEANRERHVLLKIAPHLVWPRSFLFPVHEGARVSRWRLAAALWLYDLLALFRNVRHHEMLGKRALLKAEPGLKTRGLKGGARYYDAQCDDARLTLANARDAHRHGALVANYVRVDQFETADGRIRGARATDQVTETPLALRALVVVNATGPWSDGVRPDGGRPLLWPTKGAHVAVPRSRVGNHEALTMISPIDGRVMFIVPWGQLSYIGTTETETGETPDEIRATAGDVVYLLRSANALFPEARLTPDDIVSTWAGLRPLLRPAAGADPSAISREHAIVEDAQGLISIVGGKLTTYRKMAADTVDRVAHRLHELDGRPVSARAPTGHEPLPGGEARDLDVLMQAVEQEGFPQPVAEHLVYTFGSEAPAVLRLAQADPRLAESVVEGHPAVRAELVYAMRREMAITLGDLLIRRTHLFYEAPRATLAALSDIVDLAAQEMQWDEARRAAEVNAYRYEAERGLACLQELSDRAQ